MLGLHLETLSLSTRQPRRGSLYAILVLSILLALICLSTFIFSSIFWSINSSIEKKCNDANSQIVSCFIRSTFSEAFRTDWHKQILVSFLLTYATVYFHIIIESNRTNVGGLLYRTAVLTILIIVGVGVCFPLLFIPAYIRFYKSRRTIEKSPVIVHTVYLAFIYTFVSIILPTYLYYFLGKSSETLALILAIILLASPLGFALVSIPFRFCPNWIRPCWVISSHRLIFICHAIFFILHSPLFFISFVSLCLHWSADRVKDSYIDPTTSHVNAVSVIWSADYLSLLVSLILFMITNEYFFHRTSYQYGSKKLRAFLVWFFFGLFFLFAPCLAFPLYLGWRERLYIDVR